MMRYDPSGGFIEAATGVAPKFQIKILDDSFVVDADLVIVTRHDSLAHRLHIALDRHDESCRAIQLVTYQRAGTRDLSAARNFRPVCTPNPFNADVDTIKN